MARKNEGASKALVVHDPNAYAVSGALKDKFASMLSKESAAKLGSTLWPFLGTRGAQFRLGDRKLGTEFDGVILGTAVVNQYYEGDYDPDNAQGPVCFAIADLESAQTETELDALMRNLGPPPDLATKVAERCDACPMNAWGSGKGRGKACKNGRRVTLVGYPSDNYAKTEGVRLNIPVTSVRKLADYAKRLAEMGRPLLATATRFSLAPGDRGGFEMDFEPAAPINDLKVLGVLEQRAKEGRESLLAPPSTEPRAEKPAPKAGAKRRMVKRG